MAFSRDGVAALGRIESLPGQVFIIGGLGSAGISTGPGAGKLLSDIMVGTANQKMLQLVKNADPNRLIKSLAKL